MLCQNRGKLFNPAGSRFLLRRVSRAGRGRNREGAGKAILADRARGRQGTGCFCADGPGAAYKLYCLQIGHGMYCLGGRVTCIAVAGIASRHVCSDTVRHGQISCRCLPLPGSVRSYVKTIATPATDCHSLCAPRPGWMGEEFRSRILLRPCGVEVSALAGWGGPHGPNFSQQRPCFVENKSR